MENKFLSFILSASIFVVVFGGGYYFFGTDHATTEKTYYEKTNEEASYSEESEEGLSQESYKYIPEDQSFEPEIQRSFAEPVTEYLKSNYTPSQILTLVTRGNISLACRGTTWITKVFVVDPSFVTNYAPESNEWSFWESQDNKNLGPLFTSTDNNCELFDAYYGDLNVQLYVDAVNDGVIELGN